MTRDKKNKEKITGQRLISVDESVKPSTICTKNRLPPCSQFSVSLMHGFCLTLPDIAVHCGIEMLTCTLTVHFALLQNLLKLLLIVLFPKSAQH